MVMNVGMKEWLMKMALKRRGEEKGGREIPEGVLKEVKELKDEDYFDYFCRKCGHQTNDRGSVCTECGGSLQKTKR